MNLHIFHEGQQSGPYPVETVQEMIRNGTLTPASLGWHEGLADWTPLQDLLPKPAAPAAVAVKPGIRVAAPVQQPRPAATVPAPAQPQMYVPRQKEEEPSDLSRLMRAAVAGGVAALIGGGVWAAIAIFLEIQLGFVAWGIGALAGWSISHFGRGNGVVFQGMAVICTLVGILLGKIGALIGLGFLPLSFFDAIWLIFAIGSAWKTAGGGDD